MAATTAFVCDGPTCSEMVVRAPRERFPESWPRVTLHDPRGDGVVGGSFHSPECALAWLDAHLVPQED